MTRAMAAVGLVALLAFAGYAPARTAAAQTKAATPQTKPPAKCPAVTPKNAQEALMMEASSNKNGCWERSNGQLVFVSSEKPSENYKPIVTGGIAGNWTRLPTSYHVEWGPTKPEERPQERSSNPGRTTIQRYGPGRFAISDNILDLVELKGTDDSVSGDKSVDVKTTDGFETLRFQVEARLLGNQLSYTVLITSTKREQGTVRVSYIGGHAVAVRSK